MRYHSLRTKQTGSALIISLLILIVMTLIGITGMGTSSLEEKMAGNDRDAALALQAAEAALRDGEAYYDSDLIQSPASAFNGGTAGLLPQGTNPDVLAAGTWANSRTYSGNIDDVASQPRYIIELLDTIGDTSNELNVQGYGESSGLGNVTAARITARAIGGSSNTVVTLQSNYGRRF